jgi:hypothetical protein
MLALICKTAYCRIPEDHNLDTHCNGNLKPHISLPLLLPLWSLTYLWNALFHFSFLILIQLVGLLGRGISSSQGRYLHKHRIDADKHPCLRPHSHCDRSSEVLLSSNCHVRCKLTGCPRWNVPDFGRVFLMLKYADITQNTYVQSWMVTEKNVVFWQVHALYLSADKCYQCLSSSVVSDDTSRKLQMFFLQDMLQAAMSCIVLGTLRTTMTWRASFL